MTRTNTWITLENNLALAWLDWYKWLTGGQQGEEPPLDNWGKNAIRKLVDVEHSFQAFKKATIQQREWRMLSVWDATRQQVDAGFAQYGDAAEGGDYGVAGFWTWENGQTENCTLEPYYDWRPNAVVRYMPDNQDGSEATEVTDVTLLAGQPPKDLPTDPIIIEPTFNFAAFRASMEAEGWLVSRSFRRVTIIYNGESYTRTLNYLLGCDFSDLPAPLAEDVISALNAQGLCL